MKVVVPYTQWNAEVDRALCRSGWPANRWNVSAGDDAYWHLLAALWLEGRTFTIVEHDVVVRDGALQELYECEREWCAFPVPYVGIEYAGLSCMKFDRALIQRNPDALQRVAEFSDAAHPSKHWCRLDAWLQGVLGAGGEQLHLHRPALGHIRKNDDYISPSHGCWRPPS